MQLLKLGQMSQTFGLAPIEASRGLNTPSQVVQCRESTCNAGDAGDVSLIPESGRSSGEGNVNPF